MTELPAFGARLARFIERRDLDSAALDGVSARELQAVIDGSAPSAQLLLRLAPVLGLHAQDLFVLAGAAVPQELAPLDPFAGSSAISIAFSAATLPAECIDQLRQLIESLPQEARTKPPRPPRQYEPGPGGFLLGMLEKRNLARWYTAKSVYLGTRGQIYLSEATVQHALVRSKRLAPDMFAGLAVVLGIAAADLAALTGFDLPADASQAPPSPVLAELIWRLRRLSSNQAQHVAGVARAMRS
ncbi:hypothetical protein [Actinocrinis sp.]|uniref:hypothetical protein n=1 Tax=Actinocrinis sp. TaxID=1920516 RepID=UPI002D7640F3|nr:hypothetical protein [Actinocrinis sp.]HZP53149.1 hypothetical protein [Actinocrinis sp.]